MLLVVLALLFGASEGTHQRVCSAVAHVGRWWYNGCNQRCVCEQVVPGEFVWNCYRERKEYTCMSVAERTLFITTYKAISTPGHPQYSQYQNLIARHSSNFTPIHISQWFLPWHRWFAMEMENLLQNVNCKVTLPWWDTAKNAGAPFGVAPWGASADLLGTSGACVANGGFASPGWTSNAHGCLSRTLSGTLATSMQEGVVLAMSNANYVAFTDALETQIHNLVHVRVGGTMLQTWSPEAPEFFLHHGHIDKLWDDWQKKSNAHLNAYSFPLNSVMPVAFGATPAQFNNLKATNVMYVRSSNSVSGAGHFVLNVCNLLVLSTFSIDLSVLQATIAKASPAQLLQIPQLPAPILTSAEEKMLIDMTRQSGPEKNVQEFIRKLAVAKDQLTKANEALKSAGSLRTSFDKPLDKALGFDVAKAVEVLKVPHADRSATPATTPQTCVRGAVYCVAQKRCLPVTQKC